MVKKKIIASAVAVAATFFALFQLAVAQQPVRTGGNGLQISPTRSELNISPGDNKTFTITLKNITDGELEAQVSINDFESDGVTGNPQIIVDENTRTPTSIYNFVSNLNNISLKPGQSKRATINVNVPEDAAPGAYYGVIRYAAIPKGGILNDSERQLALNASIAHLVLIEVSGEITEQIQVEDLKFGRSAENNEIRSGSFFFTPPDKSLLTINNLGNGFSRPFGSITINRMFGGEVYSSEVNNVEPKGIVLPKSTRVFIDEVAGISLPGRYTATAAVAYGNGGEVVTYKTSFWYLPVWFLISLAILFVAVLTGIYYQYKKQYSARSKKKRKQS